MHQLSDFITDELLMLTFIFGDAAVEWLLQENKKLINVV